MKKKNRLLLMVLLLCFGFGTVIGSPLFSIGSGMEWQDALDNGRVQPMMPHEWDEYMIQWREFLVEGYPYPQNEFRTAELYVYGGPNSDPSKPDQGPSLGEGLVMAWGNETIRDGSFSSAWEYVYDEDPDLSNCTITITVLAPQFSNLTGSQINAVSFGMRDVNGLIRSWQWAVGPITSTAPIKWGVPTTITINTAVPGVAAANPVASGYANNPGFDITQVLVFIVDENANWVGGTVNVPPPGTILPKPWNMWSQLSVKRHPSNPIIVGTNIDVHMDIPGAVANDFHIEGRIESGLPGGNWGNPPVLVQHIDDIFPNFKIEIVPDTSNPGQNWYFIKADWWGADIGYCKVVHLGLKFEVTCHNIIIDLKGWWTYNGQLLRNGINQGFVPVVGFDVQDRIAAAPQEQEPQMMQLRNGNGDGQQQDGEIPTEIVQMDLVALPPEVLREILGPDPFAELHDGGRQEQLPWIPVGKMTPTGQPMPIGLENPQDFRVDSFFDVFFDITITDPLIGAGVALGPVHLGPGDILVSRQRLRFKANDGNPNEFRWFYEIHEAHQRNNDLGDAPDSSNSIGAAMTAYPSGVQAMYPTVYGAGSPPFGPIHWMPTAVAHLGRNVTGEREADIMFDMDPTNNIIPSANVPNRDLADDGVLGLPFTLTPCKLMRFQYLVNVINPVQVLYANVWFDFNRDGDWDDRSICQNAVANIIADEWAVQNQALVGLPVGLNTVTSLSFRPFQPAGVNEDDPIWMRITLSEQPFTTTSAGSGLVGSGGSGPAAGYRYGETEDYIFNPKETCDRSPDLTCDNFVNYLDLAKMAEKWLQTVP